MNQTERKIIKTSQAADILEVKVSTIHKYVNEGKLKPVYEDNWQIDTTKLFYEDDVLKLKNELIKPGITTGEAAEFLGLHITTISQYIQKGIIHAQRKPYKGRELYFIEPKELERVKSELSQQKQNAPKDFFDRKQKLVWFQALQNEGTGEFGRILLNEEMEPELITNQNRKIPYDDITRSGFVPVYQLADDKYIHKKGYALFELPYEFNLGATIYKVMDEFYKIAGPKNMKVLVFNQKILVEVKPVLLPIIDNQNMIDVLTSTVKKGEVYVRHNGVYIDSEIETITFSLSSDLKQQIKEDAEKNNVNMEDYVLMIIKEKYQKDRRADIESTDNV